MFYRDKPTIAISRAVLAAVVVIIGVAAAGALYYSSISAKSSSTTSGVSTSSPVSTTPSSSSSSSTFSTASLFSTSTFSSSSATVSTSATSSSSIQTLSTFTYETTNTPNYFDPEVTYSGSDLGILQNVYEQLLWYNGSCSSCVVPWLAQSYTASSNLMTYNFTLRTGVTFADGEPFNSTAVYFSLNRYLIMDGSTPTSHGTQSVWIIQQLLNTT